MKTIPESLTYEPKEVAGIAAQEFFGRREAEAGYGRKFADIQCCEVEIMVHTSRRNQEAVRAEVRFQPGMGFCLVDSERENHMRGDERFKKAAPGPLMPPGRRAKKNLQKLGDRDRAADGSIQCGFSTSRRKRNPLPRPTWGPASSKTPPTRARWFF